MRWARVNQRRAPVYEFRPAIGHHIVPMPSFLDGARRNPWLLVVALTGFVLRIAWALLVMDRQPRFDETAYIGHAQRLLRGEGFVDALGRAASYWPIGYPAALALTYLVAGESYLSTAILSALCGTATAVLILLLATSLYGPVIGRIAAMAVAAYPNHVFFASLHLTEPLFTLLLVAAVFFLLRGPTTLHNSVAGVLFGLAALTRPAIALFPVLLPVWYLRQRYGLRAALKGAGVVVLMSFMVVTPWMLRNHRVLGKWEIASSGGDNFWIGNNPNALGGYVRPRELDQPLWDDGTRDFSRGYRLGLEAIAAEPGKAVRRLLQKTTYFFALETDGLLWNMKGFDKPWPTWITLSLLTLANVSYIAILSACVLALISASRGALPWLFGLLTAYSVTVSMVFLGDPRYHYPLVPLAAILGSEAFVHERPALWAGLKAGERWSQFRVLRWAAIMCVFSALMVANLYLKSLESAK
jgi:4-amino-4-deoxy-L-arabinose transferase-like glycosyltransferase